MATINGTSGDDALGGTTGNDVINGFDGDDILFGDAGSDTLNGGNGVDFLEGGLSNDTLSGGADFDFATYVTATVGVTVNLSLLGAQNTVGAGFDTLSGIEGIFGSDFNDHLTGDAGDNVFIGGFGTDVMIGGDGDDLFDVIDAEFVAGERYSGGPGYDVLGITASTDLTTAIIDGVELLAGTDRNFVLTAAQLDAFLDLDADAISVATAGAIDLSGGIIIVSQFTLSAGGNTLSLAGVDDAEYVVVGGMSADTVTGGLLNDEITGGEAGDTLSGDAGNDDLYGGFGEDTLHGGIGIDFLYGGDGNDVANGGDGDDDLFGGAGANVLDGGLGNDEITDGDDGSQLFGQADDDEISGLGGDDTAYGGSGDDIIEGGAGADSMYAGDGNDHIDTDAFDPVADGGVGDDTFELNDPPNAGMQIFGGDGFDAMETEGDANLSALTVEGIESYTGTFAGDELIALASQLAGVTLAHYQRVTVAGPGTLAYSGPLGVTNFRLAAPDIVLDFIGSIGELTIEGSAFADTITVNADDSEIDALAGNDVLVGGAGEDAFDGGDDDDTLFGAAGSDLLRGGLGNDLIDAGDGDEHAYGGEGADTLYGGAQDDTLEGEGGDDLIEGGSGDDLLLGGADDDILRGGDGEDEIRGSGIADQIFGEAGDDTLRHAAPGGHPDFFRAGGYVSGGEGHDTLWLSGKLNVQDVVFEDDIEEVIFNTSDIKMTGAQLASFDRAWIGTVIFVDGGIIDLRGMELVDGDLELDDVATELFLPDVAVEGALSDVNGGTADDIIHASNLGGTLLRGGAGNDTLIGGNGSDSFDGEGGNDIIYGGDGDDGINLSGSDLSGNGIIDGGAGEDTIAISLGDISDASFTNIENLFAGSLGDVTMAPAQLDGLEWVMTRALRLSTGGFADLKMSTLLASEIHFSDEDTGVFLPVKEKKASPYLIYGGDGDDSIAGGWWGANYYGGGGNDVLSGRKAGLQLYGGDGNDLLTGGTSVDWINGGADNDLVRYSTGEDLIDGGDGIDTMDYTTAGGGVTANLTNRHVTAPSVQELKDVENLIGSALDDVLTGSVVGNVLSGGQGNDSITGLKGDDIITGGEGADQLLGGADADTFAYASAKDSRASGYDTVVGFSSNADRLDVTTVVTGIDAAIVAGALSTASLKGDLKAAADKTVFGGNHAVLFTPDSGDLAGATFLIIDGDGRAGFSATRDLVIALDAPGNLANLDVSDFL